MVGELILFQPKDMPDIKVAIGQRVPDGRIAIIAKFESWQAVREYSKGHLQLGRSHLDIAEKPWAYCDRYEHSPEAEIPPVILNAFKEDEEPGNNEKGTERNGD